jgi:hypothetical protein
VRHRWSPIHSETRHYTTSVVSFRIRPLFSPGNSPRQPLDRKLGEHQNRSDHGGEDKNYVPVENRNRKQNTEFIKCRCSHCYSNRQYRYLTLFLQHKYGTRLQNNLSLWQISQCFLSYSLFYAIMLLALRKNSIHQAFVGVRTSGIRNITSEMQPGFSLRPDSSLVLSSRPWLFLLVLILHLNKLSIHCSSHSHATVHNRTELLVFFFLSSRFREILVCIDLRIISKSSYSLLRRCVILSYLRLPLFPYSVYMVLPSVLTCIHFFKYVVECSFPQSCMAI